MPVEPVREPRRILFFGDPMCARCYGFAPAIQAISARYTDRIDVRLILGGLRAGTSEPLDETRLATSADFRVCFALGVNEFPSVVLQNGTRYAHLTCGYCPFEQLQPLLDTWVGETAES